MKQQTCPDCDALLNPQKKRCSCGWNGSLPRWLREQCSYTYQGQRCPQRGAIGLDAWGVRWYCRPHFRAQYDDKKSQIILQGYLEKCGNNEGGEQK